MNQQINILVIGDASVGKTSFINRICSGDFKKSNDSKAYLNNGSLVLNFRDINKEGKSQDHIDCVVILFSLENKKSFLNVKDHYFHIKKEYPNSYILICGNKFDSDNKIVKPKTFQNYCWRYTPNVKLYEVSALSTYNLANVMQDIVKNTIGISI